MKTESKIRTMKKVFLACVGGLFLLNGITSEAKDIQEIPAGEVQPTDLDLGDYQQEMAVGEKQLLTVTILPLDAVQGQLNYTSSNQEVATVNGMGRIIALKEGTTKIKVSIGTVSAGFDLKVKKTESIEVPVTELDLGDCPRELTVGTSQILNVGVIPENATNVSFGYESSNEAVANVNALGRLTGNQLGTAQITVTCGNIKDTFMVTVVEDSSKEEKIEVQDVEIGDYEKELKVDGVLNISATVLPSNATDTTITYKSSNPEIATVNSSGEVKGIAPGQVIIYVSAGNVTRQAAITVKIATTAIGLNSDYQVMKPGDNFQISAKVQPTGAAAGLTYKSTNVEVATVSTTGLITAKSSGSTAIIVTNGELQVSVTVIVNENGSSSVKKKENKKDNKRTESEFPQQVSVEEYPVISSDMLKYFYEQEKVLIIKGKGYTIYLDGKNIVNFDNELNTKLSFKKGTKGTTFVVNKGKNLCGKLTIDISKKVSGEKYLYLYNKEKKKYQKIKTDNISTLNIDTAGKYLITSGTLSGFQVNVVLIILGTVAVIVGIGVYIGVKKQYWFW